MSILNCHTRFENKTAGVRVTKWKDCSLTVLGWKGRREGDERMRGRLVGVGIERGKRVRPHAKKREVHVGKFTEFHNSFISKYLFILITKE